MVLVEREGDETTIHESQDSDVYETVSSML